MTTITVAWLKKHLASPRQVDLFRATIGGKAEITRSNLRKLAAAGFDMEWLAAETLTPDQRQAYFDVMSALRASDDARAAVRAFDDALKALRADNPMATLRAYDGAMAAVRAFDDALKAEVYWAVTR
jgi:hypothetical protein